MTTDRMVDMILHGNSSTSKLPTEAPVPHQAPRVSELRKAYSLVANERRLPISVRAGPCKTVQDVRSLSDELPILDEDSLKLKVVPVTGVRTPQTTPPSSSTHSLQPMHHGLRSSRFSSGIVTYPHPVSSPKRHRQIYVYATTYAEAVTDTSSGRDSAEANRKYPQSSTTQISRHRANISVLSTIATKRAHETNEQQHHLLHSTWKCETRLDDIERKKRELAYILEKLEEIESQLAHLDDGYTMSPVQASATYAQTKSPYKVRPRDSLISGASALMRQNPNKGHHITRSSSSRLSVLIDREHLPNDNTVPRWNRMVARATSSRLSRLSISSVGTLESLMSNESSISAELRPMPLFRAQPTLQYFPPRCALPSKRAKQLEAAQEITALAEWPTSLGIESCENPGPQTPFERFAKMPQQNPPELPSSRVRVQPSPHTTSSAWEDIFTSFDPSSGVGAGNDSSNAACLHVIAAKQDLAAALPHWVALSSTPVSPTVPVEVHVEEPSYLTVMPSSWSSDTMESAEDSSVTTPRRQKPLVRALKRCFSPFTLVLQPHGSPTNEPSNVSNFNPSACRKHRGLSALWSRLNIFGRPARDRAQEVCFCMQEPASSFKQGRPVAQQLSSKRSTMQSHESWPHATAGIVW
ncbi:hypothetical protein LTR56_010579 [Elasticomyces elasticus]|nr:hypothetical protein LTR56_010579 [Elasticomyces elasticus]KAK4932435.1 hypothetical protein LTR49_001304 [Elasticomyces elasticus]KAK5760136.1 hypothetical protein LTS12_009691 [Elasticomyces elasticus]